MYALLDKEIIKCKNFYGCMLSRASTLSLYVLIMSRTRFRVNSYSMVA